MATNQKDIEYQRYFKLLEMFVKEGSIFLMNPSILYFGTEDNKHFAVSKHNLKYGSTSSDFNPCTSQQKNSSRPDIFAFNFNDGSTIKDINNKTTYVLLSLSRKVKLTNITKPMLCEYKGRMTDITLEEYRNAKRKFIEWTHSKKAQK
jgi:hypothetical protein